MLGMALTMTSYLEALKMASVVVAAQMPLLLATLIALALYVLTLEGALTGLAVYLLPDFEKVLSGDLLHALGSAFFSIFGRQLIDLPLLLAGNVPSVGALVALVDVGIAVLAGFLILPAVRGRCGVAVFNDAGGLISEEAIFTVLPALFETMEGAASGWQPLSLR